MIPLPNIADFIHYLTVDSSGWFNLFLPILGVILGISAAFIIAKLIYDTFVEKIENRDIVDSPFDLNLKGGKEVFHKKTSSFSPSSPISSFRPMVGQNSSFSSGFHLFKKIREHNESIKEKWDTALEEANK